MPDKSFEHTIRFYEVRTDTGEIVCIPIVTVDFIQPNGNRVSLPLLFDTGASVTTLRHELYPLFNVPSWDSGEPETTATAGGPAQAYRYQATLEFLGRRVECAVHLMQTIPSNPLYVGLFGREQIFESFGFGFWESARELYVTLAP